MPRLSDSMEEGTIVRWLKSIGDEIAVGDDLVEIETDKANVVFEAEAAGTLVEIVAAEGETLAIGATIGRIGQAGAAGAPTAPDKRIVSPVARRIAVEHGIDVAGIDGSGPNGRIVKADVEAVLAATAPRTGLSEVGPGDTTIVVAPTALQQTVARRMIESKTSAPHFYLQAAIDMTRCVAARARLKASARDEEPVPSLNDMVVKACALALRDFPRANGAYRDGKFELHSQVNVGVAVAAADALTVPTIFDADRLSLGEIAAESRRLARDVRDGTTSLSDLSAGTFTVSNLGMYGVSNFHAVLNPPQAAILAVGAILERPIARRGELEFAHIMEVTLSCDHRILYGAEGAELLARIRTLLEEPVGLAL